MKVFWKIIVFVSLLIFCSLISNAQCISDDSTREMIERIKNDQNNYYSKIRELTALQTLYLKCRPKISSVYAEILHRLGDFYAKTGNFDQGIAYTIKAVDVNIDKSEPFLCNSYYNLGVFYLQLNLVRLSQYCFINCIKAGKSFPEKYFIVGKAHTQLAYSFFEKGDYQQAKDIATNGMSFSRAARDTVEEGALWVQKSQAEVELNDLKSAGKSIGIALSMLKGKNNIQLASAYLIYASFLNVSKKYQESLIYYKKAYILDKRLGYFIQCPNDLNDLGKVYDNNLMQEDSARKYFSLGLQYAKENKDHYQMAGFYEYFGITYWREHNFKKALLYYQKGLNILPINFTDRSITSNPGIGALSQISNDYYVSTLLANKGESLLALYKETLDKALLKAALQTFRLADGSVDMMRWKQLGELSKEHWRSETKQLYENAIEVCYLLDDAESGVYFFEKSRSVLLVDQLNFSAETKVVHDIKLETRLRKTIDSLNKQLISLNNSQPGDKLKADWLSVNQEWENYQNQLIAQSYKSADKTDSTSQSLSSQQQLLKKNKQSLVEYFYNDFIVYALLVTPNRAKIYKIPYPGYLHDSGDFLKYCSNAALLNQYYDRYASLANKLYQKLFKPLLVDTKRLIISPAENFIPFDALLEDPHSEESFLLKKYAFSYVYSMRALNNYRPSSTKPNLTFLGIAPENYEVSNHLQPLTGSIASLQRIRNLFSSSLLLKGEDAKKNQLISKLPQAQIVQIYSHAASDSTTRDPVLYMADSAVLMSEIQKLKCRNTDMVVLSACNTGIGFNAVGEGLFSLARGFRLSGIPSTVTNLWQADNKATYDLTEGFYKYLGAGLPKDESLRLAKLEMIKNDQSHLLPYYWAPTIVLGDSSSLKISLNENQRNYAWLIILFAALIAIPGCIYFFVYRQKKS